MSFPEFVMTDIRENDDLTVVSENCRSAGLALIRFLISNGHEICVLKQVDTTEGYLPHRDHFTVIGEQKRFEPWLTKALNQEAWRKQPTIESVPELNEELLSRWAESGLVKELWTFFISHEYDDEFTRGIPMIRRYQVFRRYFAPVSPELKDSPELAPFREAGFLAACMEQQERLD